jgi:hypothetical protein
VNEKMPQTIKPVVQTIQGPKGEVELRMASKGFTLVRPDVQFGYVKPIDLTEWATLLGVPVVRYREETSLKINFSEKKHSHWENYTARMGLRDEALIRLYARSNSTVTVDASPRVQINTEYKPAESGTQSELNVVGVNGLTLDVAQMFAGLAFCPVYGIRAFAFQKTETPALEQLAKAAATKAKTELCIDEAYKLFRGYLGLRQEAARMTQTERALVEYLKR